MVGYHRFDKKKIQDLQPANYLKLDICSTNAAHLRKFDTGNKKDLYKFHYFDAFKF